MQDLFDIIPFGPIDGSRLEAFFNRVFEDNAYRMRPSGPFASFGTMNVYESDDNEAFVIEMTLPGVDPADLDISVLSNRVTIRGEVKDSTAEKSVTYHRRERRAGSFSRSMDFPVPIDAAAVVAKYERGLLTVTLPKHAGARPRPVKINVE